LAGSGRAAGRQTPDARNESLTHSPPRLGRHTHTHARKPSISPVPVLLCRRCILDVVAPSHAYHQHRQGTRSILSHTSSRHSSSYAKNPVPISICLPPRPFGSAPSSPLHWSPAYNPPTWKPRQSLAAACLRPPRPATLSFLSYHCSYPRSSSSNKSQATHPHPGLEIASVFAIPAPVSLS
jgi:hypothetical protein